MLDLLAFARLSELSCRKDKERCRRDEDAFYEEFGADPPAFIIAIGGALRFFVRRWPTRHARKAAHCQPESKCRLVAQDGALTRL
ncbi:hypothetical protein [Rhizobium sp. BK068]|uniref:hypothetical protein n=1 Tax=Rhizobium sp. BK068 TaxID=2512130 RepID=UPI00104E3B40|nr:hypothetical protein [Rhizobium sp. BK068]TCM64548.1 hypothetical protein EV291_14521 [Rhizobium sp. BK068]